MQKRKETRLLFFDSCSVLLARQGNMTDWVGATYVYSAPYICVPKPARA